MKKSLTLITLLTALSASAEPGCFVTYRNPGKCAPSGAIGGVFRDRASNYREYGDAVGLVTDYYNSYRDYYENVSPNLNKIIKENDNLRAQVRRLKSACGAKCKNIR